MNPPAPAKRHHVLAILLVSILALIINCYPVIFCGRSFASTTGVAMLYDWWPPLPNMPNVPQTNNHGSDTPALLIGEIPMGFIESRSVWEHGEIPLWNRYGHAGYTLIGQAISMLGDPLQFIVILGHGSAVAWDLKFLCAKLLFCVGFAWLILRLTGDRLLSLVYAALSAYCGAFFYINNHPAFFVFSYAPWILLSALNFLDLPSKKSVPWGLVWLLANFSCFNAGHVELAVVLIIGLNTAAMFYTLLQQWSMANALQIFLRLGIGGLLFLGLTAPVWLSFLGTLGGSYSSHLVVKVYQLPFQNALGAFDDMFYQLLRTNSSLAPPGPASSLLIFVGCAFSVLRWRQMKSNVFYWVNAAAIVVTGACIFGLVPGSLLAAIPLFNHVGHQDTDLSYLLAIQLTVQSAFGFKCLIQTHNFRRTMIDLLVVAAVLAGMIALFCIGPLGHLPMPWGYVICTALGALGAPLLFAFLMTRYQRIPYAGWVGIIILAFIPHFRFGLYNFGPDHWLMIPGVRAELDASSPSIETIKAAGPEPFRVMGVGFNLYGDYAAVYGLEDIRSSAPLSNRELIELFKSFPGIEFSGDWAVRLANLVPAQPLLNMLNVKYLLGPPQVTLPPGLDFRVIEQGDFGVAQNFQVWPRAFFTAHLIPIASNDVFVKELSRNGTTPFIALTPDEIRKQPGLEQLESASPAPISAAANYQLLPNSTAFDVHAASPGIVCLTEGIAPDFLATANGQPKQVLTVNRAFKGIYLDKPGDYHIAFVYRPPHWRLACELFWGSLAIAIILASACTIRRRSGGKN
ncbi:MAG TPA: hypothetical protein VGN23_00390 [Verrucomicrobiae bacterium]|jgi:hypothetical protein